MATQGHRDGKHHAQDWSPVWLFSKSFLSAMQCCLPDCLGAGKPSEGVTQWENRPEKPLPVLRGPGSQDFFWGPKLCSQREAGVVQR